LNLDDPKNRLIPYSLADPEKRTNDSILANYYDPGARPWALRLGADKADRKIAKADSSQSCEIALLPNTSSTAIDTDIRTAQEAAKSPSGRTRQLEQLAWLYVAKARATHDDGYYNIALQTATCLLESSANSHAAKLIEGHVMHSLHRFQEAQKIAALLVTERGNPYDYGLLGDALMDQGQLDEAQSAYQRMIDLRPGLQSYSRGAHMMWLRGDTEGAINVMRSTRPSFPIER